MTLDERLLENLANWRPDSGRQTLTVSGPTPNTSVNVTADRSDVVGAQLWEVAYHRPATLDAAGLRAWGPPSRSSATTT